MLLSVTAANHGLQVHAGGGNSAFISPAFITHSFVWADCVYSAQGPLILLICKKILWHHLSEFCLFLVSQAWWVALWALSFLSILHSPLVSTLCAFISHFLPLCSFVTSPSSSACSGISASVVECLSDLTINLKGSITILFTSVISSLVAYVCACVHVGGRQAGM